MPEWKDEIRQRLSNLKLAPTREAEIVEELAQHLEDRYSELRSSGATDEEARCAALAELSDRQLLTRELKRVEEQVVQEPVVLGSRRINMFADLWQDLRYGLRMLRKNPAFTAIAVLTLALGIGANTALFSVADEVLLKSLPVRNPEQLVLFSWASGPRLMGGSFWPGVDSDPTTGASTSQSFSYLTLERFQTRSNSLSDVFGFTAMFRMSGLDNDQDSPSGQMVSGNYYSALGVPPALGRMILPDDDKQAATPVTVISYRYWQREFGFDPAAVGKIIKLGNTAFTIVGITPAGFAGTQDLGVSPDFSIPLAMAIRVADIGPKFTDTMKKEPWLWTLRIMGRLRPGVSFDEVRADLQEVFQATAVEGWHADPDSKFAKQVPDTPRLEVATGSKGLTAARRSLSKVMIILMAVVGLVLLIVCSNLANLLLARGATRQKEIAVRLAVGAGRSRVIRQLLTESSLLALCGAGLGTLFAFWGKDLFLAWINRITPSFAIQPQIDLRVLGFTVSVTMLTGILVGIVPALRATRVDINQVIKGSSGSASGARSFGAKAMLVAQVAMSVVLLVGAGLFVRTLRNLQSADVGFNTENLLVFKVYPRWNKHKRAQLRNLYEQIIERIQAVPGVQAATNSGSPLLSGDLSMPVIWVPGQVRQAGEDLSFYEQRVWPNFFETMGMPLLLGRNLTQQDAELWRAHGTYVAVVNETLARRHFPNTNPIGQRFGETKVLTNELIPDSELIEIVGVVRDAKYATVREPVRPTAFFPFSPNPVTFEVRTAVDPVLLAASIREAVEQVDTDLRLADFTTQSEQAKLTFAQERHLALLSSVFGLLALLLACIGLYGLLSYGVANRTHEIGIRMALGARAWDVVLLVMRETLLLVFIGVVIGLGSALAATRLIASMLYGLAPNDLVTITFAISLMIAVAALAGVLPARRATRVDPMVALRYE